MLSWVIGDAEGGIEDKCLCVEITDGGLMGQVVVSAGTIEANLKLDVAIGQAPVQDLADVYAYLRHYSKKLQRTPPNILPLSPSIIFQPQFRKILKLLW